MLIGLHHVQLAMPIGGEAAARAFYGGILAMDEVARPVPLAAAEGCWFESGSVRVLLGVEAGFIPARKAHPAFLVASLDSVAEKFTAHGIALAPPTDLPGFRRINLADPFGNRIDLLERVAWGG